MKNPISWNPSLNGILLIDSQLTPTIFDIEIGMEVVSDVYEEQEIALQRIQTIIESMFASSIICEMTESAVEMPYTFVNNIVAVPGIPTDQLLCGITYTKTNAVAEGKIIITSVRLSTTRGNGIQYYVDQNISMPLFLQKTADGFLPWWLRNDVSTTDSFQIDKNIISFPFEYPTWEEIDLGWDSMKNQEQECSGIVINFDAIKKQ